MHYYWCCCLDRLEFGRMPLLCNSASTTTTTIRLAAHCPRRRAGVRCVISLITLSLSPCKRMVCRNNFLDGFSAVDDSVRVFCCCWGLGLRWLIGGGATLDNNIIYSYHLLSHRTMAMDGVSNSTRQASCSKQNRLRQN